MRGGGPQATPSLRSVSGARGGIHARVVANSHSFFLLTEELYSVCEKRLVFGENVTSASEPRCSPRFFFPVNVRPSFSDGTKL